MGKKSKRRTGKKESRNQKKAGAVEDDEEVVYAREQQLEDELLKDINQEAFEEFMIWSFSDRADLSPKKFEMVAPDLAKLILELGQAFTIKHVQNGLEDKDFPIKLIWNRRERVINALEEKRKEFQLVEGIQFLMTQVTLGCDEDQAKFHQELEEIAEKQKAYMEPFPNIFTSFQQVSMKWRRSGFLILDYCRFNGMDVSTFCDVFEDMATKLVETMNDKLFQKFYFHPSAGQVTKKCELQKQVFSLLSLYREMNICWECKAVKGKAFICASCKCSAYCSQECQARHWKDGKHKERCEYIGSEWSTYTKSYKRIKRALYKDERVYTKSITVDGIEKKCFLRPCEWFDHYVCQLLAINGQTGSINIFYKNMAKLACGGIFGDETISSQLEEKIRTSYEDIISEFDPKTLKEDEIIAMQSIAEKLICHDPITISWDISVERFLTLYICLESYQNHFQYSNKFEIEKKFLQTLKTDSDMMK